MWKYFRLLFNRITPFLIRTSILAVVLFITVGLFIQWSFPKKQTTRSTSEITIEKENDLIKTFQQSEYQTERGKQIAVLEKRIYCSLTGSLCSNRAEDSIKNFPKSFFGHFSSLIVAPLVNPPSSGIAYFQESAQKAGFVKKTYAAEGIGFASLNHFLPVWGAFRNMAYLILVIIIIIIGFMVMFQYKIDSHTILSVQSALPRIVISLLMITFSYAIAGLLVDLTYVLIMLIFQIFSMTKLPGMNANELQNQYLTSNIFSLGEGQYFIKMTGNMYFKALINILTLLPWQLQVLINSTLAMATNFVGVRLASNSVPIVTSFFADATIAENVLGGSLNIGKLVGAFWAFLGSFIMADILMLFFFIILALVGVLFLYFRILFLLVSAYVQIIINVIFAPVFLLIGTIPGQDGFSSWIKQLVGNLLVFPLVICLILVIQVIQGIGLGGSKGAFSMPLLYNFETDVLALIITGAFLFAIPDIVKTVVKKVAGEPSIKAGPGLILGGAGILAGSAMGAASQLHTLSKLAGGSGELPGLSKLKGWFSGKMQRPGDHGGGGNDNKQSEKLH